MIIKLLRNERSPDGTFGILDMPGLTVFTMEDDWKDNQPRVSCIPAGEYELRRTIYYKRGIETFEVMDVPGRSRILIHPANTEEDVEGCIGLGLRMGKLLVRRDEDTGERNVFKRAVVSSALAFKSFMNEMNGVDVAQLHISWDRGLP